MIHLQDLLDATGGQLVGGSSTTTFPAFCYNTQRLSPGELFVAVKSEGGDGHDYIPEALARGAGGILCQFPPPEPSVPCIVVADTRAALAEWATHVLRTVNPDTIAVTGSTGKTDTCRAISAVLATQNRVFANPPGLSNTFGIPLSIEKLEPDQEIAVFEIAAHAFGDVAAMAELIQPRIAVVTSIARAHLAYLNSLGQITTEKAQLPAALPADGLAILNYDDPRVLGMRKGTAADVVTFGLSPDADIVASDLRPTSEGLQMVVHFPGVAGLGIPGFPAKGELFSQLHGRHQAYPLLAAISVGIAYDLPWSTIRDALESLRPGRGRLRVLGGINDSLLLDGSAGSNPASALQALGALEEYPAERRIAVLGDMAQLGSYAVEGHHVVGEAAADTVDLLITNGERAAWIAEGAEAAGLPRDQITVTHTIQDTVRKLSPRLRPGDVVLIKGDVETHLEKVVERLLRDQAESEQLVRRLKGLTVQAVRPSRPTWLEVDLEAVAHNVQQIKDFVGTSVDILAVLKADAYGHGAIKVARTALNNGASCCGVASVNEAVRLRDAGIAAPILVLGYTPAWLAKQALLHDVTLTVYDVNVARLYSRAAEELRRTARLHIKVDTGMGRLGLLPDQVLPFAQKLRSLPGLDMEGIFTHFSVADEEHLDYTRWQLDRFRRVLTDLTEEGITFRRIHCANSSATLRLPESHFNMVRVGLAMYGLRPSHHVSLPEASRPALAWKTSVAQVKTLPPDSFVSYGNTYRTCGEETVGVIPVGYADGFRRAPTRWEAVLVRGRRAPIIGRVCMDQTMIRLDHIPEARVGDEVVLIGCQGADEITAEEVAAWLGTINYEVVSEILARVPRIV